MAYWSLAFEFHRAILSLIEQKFYGAAFPLLKLFVEGTRELLGFRRFLGRLALRLRSRALDLAVLPHGCVRWECEQLSVAPALR